MGECLIIWTKFWALVSMWSRKSWEMWCQWMRSVSVPRGVSTMGGISTQWLLVGRISSPPTLPSSSSHPVVLRSYFWLCTQGLLLVGLRGPYRRLGMETGLTVSKVSALPTVLFLGSWSVSFLKKKIIIICYSLENTITAIFKILILMSVTTSHYQYLKHFFYYLF